MTDNDRRPDTETVLGSVWDHGLKAFEVLCKTYPAQAVIAAFEREVRDRNLECGVTVTRPWLTETGMKAVTG